MVPELPLSPLDPDTGKRVRQSRLTSRSLACGALSVGLSLVEAVRFFGPSWRGASIWVFGLVLVLAVSSIGLAIVALIEGRPRKVWKLGCLGVLLGLVALAGATCMGVVVALEAFSYPQGYPPSDAELRSRFRSNRGAFQQLCEEFNALGITAVGRHPGKLMLAYGNTWLFSMPSDAQLTRAGMNRAQFESILRRLAELDASSVRRLGRSIRIDVWAAHSDIDFVCGAASVPLVGGSASKGHSCDVLDPGWWVCYSHQ